VDNMFTSSEKCKSWFPEIGTNTNNSEHTTGVSQESRYKLLPNTSKFEREYNTA
jgi:hypothetical protein